MRARITKDGWTDPDSGDAVPKGKIVDGRAARLAYAAGSKVLNGKTRIVESQSSTGLSSLPGDAWCV